MRQGETILEVYCASGNRRRSFFVTEGGKLAKSLLSLKTLRRRFISPKILFKYGGEERTGECLSRQNTHEEEEEAIDQGIALSGHMQ
jgi:hypothetical protein